MVSKITDNIFSDLLLTMQGPQENDKLEKSIVGVLETLGDLKKLELENQIMRTFFDSCAAWILKNFSSIKLNSIINLISVVLSKLSYKIEIKREEIVSLLQLETYEQLINNDKKEKNKEILSNDSILTNSLLASFYTLILTIANKPEIIIKSKNLLRSVLGVISQICEIDNIAIYYKKKRLITVFYKIIRELKNNQDTQDSLYQILKIVMHIYAKVGKKRPVYRDYMFKKAIPEKISDIFINLVGKNPDITKDFSIYCFFTIRIVDHRNFFWTKGVINIFIDYLNKQLASDKPDEIGLEYVTLIINNLSIESYDIQEDLIELKFLEIAKDLMMKYSKNEFIIFNIISTLRRIKDEEYMDKIAEEFLFTFFALFDYFYLAAKKITHIQDNSCKFEFLILKELVAILGNIVKDEIHSKPFIEKNLHLVLIDLKLSFYSIPKLLKNTIGSLINLTTSNEIRENVSKVAAFIQSIYIVLDKYQENQAIIDYELKLIINVMKNDLTVKAFIGGELTFYLLLFLKSFTTHDEITFNTLKILRSLILKKKGYDEFIEKLLEFYCTVGDINNHEELAYQIFVNDLVKILEIKEETINICIEIFLLLSYLANQNENLKKKLDKNESFLKVLNRIIVIYSKDEKISKLISQCIAQLPIEEFEVNQN